MKVNYSTLKPETRAIIKQKYPSFVKGAKIWFYHIICRHSLIHYNNIITAVKVKGIKNQISMQGLDAPSRLQVLFIAVYTGNSYLFCLFLFKLWGHKITHNYKLLPLNHTHLLHKAQFTSFLFILVSGTWKHWAIITRSGNTMFLRPYFILHKNR